MPPLINLDNDLIGITDAEYQVIAILHQVQRFENELSEIGEGELPSMTIAENSVISASSKQYIEFLKEKLPLISKQFLRKDWLLYTIVLN